MEDPTDEDLRRLDRGRKDKKVSNEEWQSPTDGESRIARMKDGRTRLAYKAEHAVDLESEAIVGSLVTFADRSDGQSAPLTLTVAQSNLVLAGSQRRIEEVVMDKGYHDNSLLVELAQKGIRTYVPERRQRRRCWRDKPLELQKAFRANRRRVRSDKGRRLNRWRSERCERTFAHVCDTGGGRRSWLRGIVNVSKTYMLRCAAYNLGLLLRKLFGLCKPRSAEAAGAALFLAIWAILALGSTITGPVTTAALTALLGTGGIALLFYTAARITHPFAWLRKRTSFLTGC